MTEFDFNAAFDRLMTLAPMTLQEQQRAWIIGTIRSYELAGITNRFRVEPDNGPAELVDLPAYSVECAAHALARLYAQRGHGGAGVRHERGNTYSFESNEMEDDVAARYEFDITPIPVRGGQ